MRRLAAQELATPLGTMLAVADAAVLHFLEFTDDPDRLEQQLRRLKHRTGSEIGSGRTPPIEQVEAELARYFDGRSARFRTALTREATPFQLAVWDALCRIPPGETTSYGALAAAAGRPAAIRAAGTANGANPISIVIPCHRAIGADGSLTKYGGGLHRKRWLLEHERRWAKPR
ncbi:MAG TPA: methylated-DNA--[protein]-cysteine S-methyltransferase [Kiloniellales bacterium]|nr:methylated-DNA--[protein]-cysteine S-methyltransferase [Kiloniellales bacterium]